MNVLLTGHQGYIGSNLIGYLTAAGHIVIGFDLPRRDITNRRQILMDMEDMDAVIHTAAIAAHGLCEAEPETAEAVNDFGSQNVADAAKFWGAKMVYTSSLSVKTAQFVYGKTKLAGEAHTLGASGVVLRLANIYGGFGFVENKPSALAVFMRARLKGEKVNITGDGSQLRDFVHVDDVCKALVMALDAPSGIYEVCTGDKTSILQMAEAIGVEYEFVDPRPTDVHDVPTDTSMWLPNWKPMIRIAK